MDNRWLLIEMTPDNALNLIHSWEHKPTNQEISDIVTKQYPKPYDQVFTVCPVEIPIYISLKGEL